MKTNLLLLLLSLAAAGALPASLVDDRRMEAAAKASYVYRTVLQGRVKVSAEFGVLTLTGSVENPADKVLAEDTVRSLSWVSGIQNKIVLQPSFREQSDPWIALMIRTRLRVRANVNAEATTISVSDGMVTLTGTARDAAQKERTALIAAEIQGVNYVRNNLVIAALPNEAAPDDSIDDASITAQVRAALRDTPATQALAVTIATTEGAVRITGEARTEAEKALVTELARRARGVRFVTNTIKLRD